MDPIALHWHCQPFDRLDRRHLYGLLQLRCAVFIVEQACPYLDPDGKDCLADTHHLYACDGDGQVLACLRLLAPGVSYAQPSIGRVANAASTRGSGLGRALMRRGIAEASRLWPGQPLRIGAQAYLRRFYESLGFVVDSAEYLEDGIPHFEMQRPADAVAAGGTPTRG
jgi:ElaA protein